MMRFKYLRHLLLSYFFKFDSWHISPIESREYCLDVVDYINSEIESNDCVVEIGCGLGETISSIHCLHKHGYDKSYEVIRAAKMIDNRKYNTIFKVGSFDLPVGLEIKYLITLNFLHDFDTDRVSQWFKLITDNNNVLNIIVDELDYDNYYKLHRFDSIIPKKYKEIKTIVKESYTFGRSVKVFSLNF
ncbi:hypothetical protein OAC71_00195 [Candidatus Thioglobus sp.]|nr:hypothetical protein [Candidatus Thioglobus sp.]